MLPPCSGAVRSATVSGTPLNDRSLASTLTSCLPPSRYSGATWLAISSAPWMPLDDGFHGDHGGAGVRVEGPMMSTAMPASAARATATSAPVRNWKRGEYAERFGVATAGAPAVPRRWGS